MSGQEPGRAIQAQAQAPGEPVGRRMGQQGSVLLASHKACQEGWWFLPYCRGGVERGGGSCLPMGESSINLVNSILHTRIVVVRSGSGHTRH